MADDPDDYTPLSLGRGGLRVNHPGASDAGSKRLDSDLKSLRDELARDLASVAGLVMKVRVPKDDTITPCEPDGGAWYFQGKLVAVFEAKKQQNAGNAIERWYKNNYRCRSLNSEVSYVTFCRGEGAHERGVMGVALHAAHKGWNEYHAGGNSCWMERQGFTREFLKEQMRAVLIDRVQHGGGRIDGF
jgi:hypothetical protein